MILHLYFGRWLLIVCPPSGAFTTARRYCIIGEVSRLLQTLTYIIGGTPGYHWSTQLLKVPEFT